MQDPRFDPSHSHLLLKFTSLASRKEISMAQSPTTAGPSISDHLSSIQHSYILGELSRIVFILSVEPYRQYSALLTRPVREHCFKLLRILWHLYHRFQTEQRRPSHSVFIVFLCMYFGGTIKAAALGKTKPPGSIWSKNRRVNSLTPQGDLHRAGLSCTHCLRSALETASSD